MAEAVRAADGRIHMLDSSGRAVLVPEDQIQQAYGAGFTVEAPEAVERRAIARERGTLGQQALLTAEAGLSGVSAGTSDVLGAAVLGPEWAQAARERREANPHLAIAAEFGGALIGAKGAGLLRASPAALAARIGEGAGALVEGASALAGYRGATTAGRLAAGALKVGAAGAAEGALWGAGSAASRSALEGQDITAEKLLAGAGEGAELGGIFGAGLGAGSELVSAGARRAARAVGLEGGLGGLRDAATLRSVGFRRGDVRRLGPTAERVERRVAELADDIRGFKFRGNTEATKELKGASLWERASNPEQVATDLTLARREIGSELGAIRGKIDDAIRDSRGPASLVSERGLSSAEFLRTGMRDESAAFARRAYEGADAARAEQIATREIEPVRVELFPQEDGSMRVTLGDGRHRMQAATDAGARHIRAEIQQWTPDGDVLELGEHVVSLAPERTGGPDVAGLLRRVESEVLAPMRSSLSPDVQARAAKIERSLANLVERQNSTTFAELDQLRRDLRSVFQPKRPAGGGIPAAVPEHAAELEQVERMVSQTIDDSAVATLKQMGEDPAQYLELKRQFGALRDIESVATRAAADEVGRGLTSPWERILGFGGAIGALASGNVGALAAGIGGAAASRVLQNYGDRALVKMLDVVSKIDSTVSATAKALAGKDAPTIRGYAAVPVIVSKAVDQYQRTREALDEIKADPRTMLARLENLTGRYSVEYPGVSAAVQAKAIAQVQAIEAAMPEPFSRASASLTPTAEEPIASIHDIGLSLRKIRAITAPAAVIQDIRNGEVDLEAIKQMRETSPALYAELRTSAMREVATRGEALGMRERLFLGLAFDFVSDYSLRPGVIAAIQASHAPPPEVAAADLNTSPPNATPPGSMSDRLEGM